MVLIKRVSVVLAKWCPHCVPLSLQYANKMVEDLGVPLRILDIDFPEQEEAADRLVKEHGDWSEDYLIPQVFLEYVNRRVDHVFTGFSEGVSVTEACWENFFSSNYYQTLKGEQALTDPKLLKEFVEKYLTFKGRCRRHCDGPTSFTDLWYDSDGVVGAYFCPDGYVSRVIYFCTDPDIDWFKNFLVSQVGEEIVKERALRPATRHGWELGDAALAEMNKVSPAAVIREIYWTTYSRTEGAKSRGVFLCSDPEKVRGCGRLFVQDIKTRDRLCPKCR